MKSYYYGLITPLGPAEVCWEAANQSEDRMGSLGGTKTTLRWSYVKVPLLHQIVQKTFVAKVVAKAPWFVCIIHVDISDWIQAWTNKY